MIGIFGGTFDPIHYGHLRTVLDVKEGLNLEQVLFVPLKQAVHRNQPQVPAEQRLTMVQAAIADEDGFNVDEVELERDGPSYMVDTLHALRDKYPDKTFCLLLGGDAFNDFLFWRQPEVIASICCIIVMQRPGYALPDDPRLREFVAKHQVDTVEKLQQSKAGAVFFQSVTQLDISATAIRNRLAKKLSVRFLLPDSVIQIIRGQHLYGC